MKLIWIKIWNPGQKNCLDLETNFVKMQKLDRDGYGEVTLEDFIQTCTKDPILRFIQTQSSPFLNHLSHFLFGIFILVQLVFHLISCLYFPGSLWWLGMAIQNLIEAVNFLKIFCSLLLLSKLVHIDVENTIWSTFSSKLTMWPFLPSFFTSGPP